jgi:hypothetical protein
MIVVGQHGFILDSNHGLIIIRSTEKLIYGSFKLVRTTTIRRHDPH